MQKFMQILATLALLLVLALVIPLTLAACGGTRTEDTSYPRPEYSGLTLHRWRRIRARPIFIPGQKTAEPKLNTVYKDDTKIYTEQNVQAE